MRASPGRRLLLLLPCGILISGCGGGGGGGGPSTMTMIAKSATSSGDAQSGTVAQPLANPLQVLVTESGAPSPGITVAWSTQVSGGALNPASGQTDANGIATSNWTLGTVSGTQTARATLSGAVGSPVIFTASAAPEAATSIIKAGGDNQTGDISTQLPSPVQAKVADQFGNGVPGVDVGWEATGATLSSALVSSNGAGISAVTVTLGATAGPVNITATAAGLTGSPLAFSATAAVPSPLPTQAAVRVGNIFFQSDRNTTSNPAVDTIAVGGRVTWTWTNTLITPHSVRSLGSPSFTSSQRLTGNGETYSFSFTQAGTYQYDCAVHGAQMTGRIVVR